MARRSNCSNSQTPNIQPVYRTKWTSNGLLGEGSALVLMLNPGLGCRSRETRVTETMRTYSRPCTEVALWRIGPVKSASIPQHPVHPALFGDRVTSGIAWSSLSPETLHVHSAKCAKTLHHIFHRQREKYMKTPSLLSKDRLEAPTLRIAEIGKLKLCTAYQKPSQS